MKVANILEGFSSIVRSVVIINASNIDLLELQQMQ